MTCGLRVAVVAGGWPADTSYLLTLAEHVHLVLHHSDWLPAGQDFGLRGPTEIQSVAHRPLARTTRGHLLFYYPGLNRALTEQNPDLVHVISEPWGLLAVQAALWGRRHPHARIVMHGCDTVWHHGSPNKQRLRRALLRVSMPGCAAFVAENSKALDVARTSGLPPSGQIARIHTNPRDSGVWRVPAAEERAAARSQLGIGTDTLAIGFSGRLVPEKGVRLLLDAARILHARGRPAHVFVAGAGPLEAEVRRFPMPNVTALGSLPHPVGVIGMLRAMDVFACPSLTTSTWEDQGPRALLEAMMCGVVPVATATGGIPEMMAGQGVLCGGLDAVALADALEAGGRLAGSAENRAAVAEAAASEYSGDAVAAKLLHLWNSLVGTRFDHPDALARGNAELINPEVR